MPDFTLTPEDIAAAKAGGLFDFNPQGPTPPRGPGGPAYAPPWMGMLAGTPLGTPPPGTLPPGAPGGPAYAVPPGIPIGALAQPNYGALADVLQPSDEAKKSALTHGLLAAALGVLAHSYTRPGEGPSGIAEGLQEGLSGYGQALEKSRKRGLENLQLGEYVSGLQQQQALRAALSQGDQDKVRQILTMMNPKEAATQMLKPQSLEEKLAAAMNDPTSPFYQAARKKYLGIEPGEALTQDTQYAASLSDITAGREKDLASYREQLERGRPTKETWTTSPGLTDAEGNPVQVSSLGNTRPLTGVKAPPKPVPPLVSTKLQDHGQMADTTERLNNTFKPEYGGHTFTGEWSNTIGRWAGDDTGQVQWWQDYQNHTNTVRNKLFGSALTPTEQTEWARANVDPRMNSGEIQKNLAARAKLEAIGLERAMRGSVAAGYNKGQIEEITGRTIGSAPMIPSKTLIPANAPTTTPAKKTSGFSHLWE